MPGRVWAVPFAAGNGVRRRLGFSLPCAAIFVRPAGTAALPGGFGSFLRGYAAAFYRFVAAGAAKKPAVTRHLPFFKPFTAQSAALLAV